MTPYPVTQRAYSAQLCFETDEIEALYQARKLAAVEFIYAIQEQPWGQRVMRLYDRDGHVLGIGATMEAVLWRLYSQGWSIDRIRG